MTGNSKPTYCGKVPWSELGNLVQDEFELTHEEASELADRALEGC